MAVPTVVHLRLGPDGTAQVNASMRLTGDSFIACHTYPDLSPILHIEDAHVSVSIAAGDSKNVTRDDLDQARRLAGALTVYIADLERHVTAPGPAGDVAA
jgi:hypothetical protein